MDLAELKARLGDRDAPYAVAETTCTV